MDFTQGLHGTYHGKDVNVSSLSNESISFRATQQFKRLSIPLILLVLLTVQAVYQGYRGELLNPNSSSEEREVSLAVFPCLAPLSQNFTLFST
jgi:hypothetical protein